MVEIIILIGFSFVFLLLFLAFIAVRDYFSFYFTLRRNRKKALKKCNAFLVTKGLTFGNLTIENKFCSITVKQLQNQLVGMSKVFDSVGQKKVFVARCTVEKIWNADSLFNVIANSFNADIKYEDIRRRVIEYSILEEQVYAKDESRNNLNIKAKNKKFNPKAENFKKVEINNNELQGSLIDINTASTEELEKLPGITAIHAKKIVSYREKMGLFKSVDEFFEIMEIKGSIAQKIRGHICTMCFVSESKESSTAGIVPISNNSLRELDAVDNIDKSESSSNYFINDNGNEERVVDFD